MRTIAAIRTNKWTDEEERLMAMLRPVFGSDLAVVFHNRPEGIAIDAQVIDINADWVMKAGLVLVPDWGWRCGDYFYYRLKAALPEFSHYWLIEPDVHFTSPAAGFFDRFTTATEDALGYALGPFGNAMRFARGLPGIPHSRALFALTRFSGRALDMLFERRRAMSERPPSMRNYPNDELFCFSHCVNDPGTTTGRLEDRAPDWFDGTQFAPDPDLLFDAVATTAPAGRLLHPVRSRDSFKKALARRLSASAGMVFRMREALECLGPQDVDDIAMMTADGVRDIIVQTQRQNARQRRRKAGVE